MASLCPDNVIPVMSPEELMAFAISNDPDTLTYREAMAAPDEEQFAESMVKEVQDLLDLKMLHPVPRSKVPPTATVLPAVWVFHQKCRQTTGEVHRWKGRSCWCPIQGRLPVPRYPRLGIRE